MRLTAGEPCDDAWVTYLTRVEVGSKLGVTGLKDPVKNHACMALCHALVYSVRGDSMRAGGGARSGG
jgi:hypothetical protein